MSAQLAGGRPSRRMRRRLGSMLMTVALMSIVFAWPIARPVLADSTPYGQQLYWTEDLSAPAGRRFGANQAVVIHTGSMAFVPGPICTGFLNGQNDFIYPATDVYIVPTGTVQDYGALEDVSQTPNTIVAGASSGLFIDEYIGTAGGKFPPEFEDRVAAVEEQLPGMIPEGTYDVVYDECQDGKFQPTIDALFSGVVVVDFAGVTPPFPSQALQDQKSDALAMRMAITEGKEQLEKRFEAGYDAASVYNPSVAFIRGLGTRTMYADPAAVTLSLYEDQAAHYDGIFADPPDPAFDQLTLLGPAMPRPAATADDVGQALAAAAVELDAEARIAEALLHAMERYQGAVAAGDAMWALAQARAMVRYATLLQAQLAVTRSAVAAVAAAILADPTDLEAGADDLAALAAAVAAGNDIELVRAARNAGLDDAGISERTAALLATDWATWTRADAVAAIGALQVAEDDMAAGLPGFGTALADAIAAMEADAAVPEPFPVASINGPYTGSVGVPLLLDASASLGSRLPIANYEVDLFEWDLDGDGQFDDATGASPTVTFDRPFHGWIGVRVTNGLGTEGQDVAYARADIATTNGAPRLLAISPASDPEVVVGSPQAFSVGASDPDGDTVTIDWYLDGAFAGSGSGFSWTPSAIGVHSVEVVATDAEGAATTRSWLVLGRAPDGDADGWYANVDCDDADPAVNPGQAEILLNGKDDDCDPATSDEGQAPTAAFVSSASAGGRNVALLDTGPFASSASALSAIPVAQSPALNNASAFAVALNLATEDIAWVTVPAAVRYGVVRLWNNEAWLVDRVAIMPRIDFPTQRVRDFAVDVSTTGFASESDWTNVLTATAADSGTLQTFVLPGGPVMARYVRVRLLSNRGDPSYISVEQFKVYTTQQSGGSTFDFEDRSTDPENDIVSRLWTFGDGATSSLATPSHTYAAPGSYPVTLGVTDSRGHTSSTTLVHRVLSPPTGSFPQPPTINEKQSIVTAGYTVGDPDGERVVRLTWNWGDGSAEQIQVNPNWLSHTYQNDGVYSVRMTMTDAQEQVATFERTVTVLNVAPTATLADRTVLDDLPYDFTITASDVADPISCEWDFGDGSPPAAAANCGPQRHAYPAMAEGAPNATYTLTVRVSDDDVTVTRTATVTVIAFEPAPFDFDVFYTRWRGATTANKNVKKVHVAYEDGAGLALGAKTNIALTGGADGIVFAPDGDLIVGGQSSNIYKVDPDTGTVLTRNAGVGSLHVMLDPTGTKVWTSGLPGTPADVPLNPFSNGTARSLTGSDTTITSIAWDDDGDAYYTSSGPGGNGSFGRINLTTFQTTRLFSGIAAAHGMVYDPYTGWFLLFGSTWITQIDPATETIVASRNFGGPGFDQGGVDGKGHLFVASSSDLFFVDYSRTGRIDDPANYTFRGFLDPDVDDIAPPAGLGGQPPIALDQSVSTMKNTALAVSLTADGPLTTWEIVAGPSHGTLSGTAPDLLYTPALDYVGADSFTFRALNGVASSNTATVSITVVAGDVPPVADAGGPYETPEGTAVVLDGSASSDLDGDTLTYAWDLDLDGEYDDATGAQVSMTPDDGPAVVTVGLRVTAGGVSADDVATLAVTNVAPTATLDAPASVAEGSAFTISLGSPSDPSAADTAAGFEYAFDCGAGYGAFGSAASTTCTAGDDDLDPTVRGRIRDDDGGVSEYTARVSVTNAPPSGTFGASSPILEGGSSTLAWTGVSDPSAADAAALRFSFSCDASLATPTGDWSVAGGTATATCAYDDDGEYSVLGKLIDPDNANMTAGRLVTVTNVAPTATLDAPASVAEGSAFTLSLGSPSDPSAADTAAGFEYAFDCGAGYGSFGAATSVECPATANDGSLAVGAKIRDKDLGTTTYSATVVVTNVAPSASLANDGPTPWGLPVRFEVTAADPSPVDAAALTYEWDFNGDGTYDAGPFADSTRTFSYPAPDSFTAKVRICDDDSCSVAETAVSVTRRETALFDETAASVQYSDPMTLRARLEDTDVAAPIVGQTVDFAAGPYAGSASTDSAGRASAAFSVGLPAGSLPVHAGFAGDAYYEPASVDTAVTILREDATLAYSGDTFATGTSARLAATVSEAADGSLGDITRAWVTFDVYVGATACGSGTPVRYGPVAVTDTGTAGDGIGSAEYTMPTPGEQTYCIVARLTGGGQLLENGYYVATPSQNAVLTVVSTTGTFATGGGWIVDPDVGGHGNFGFTARFTKTGAPKGQAVYVWRGVDNGSLVDFIVKSSAITGLAFSDELGNGTFPWRAMMTGKATLRINRASDGVELLTDGNATFTLVAIDSGKASGIGVDSFAVRVLDKDGREYKVVGTWSGSTYESGILLSGGNVMVHLK